MTHELDRVDLEEALRRFSELTSSEHFTITDNYCRYCRHTGLELFVRLRAVPNASVAGAQPKVVARTWPWLRCLGCRRESAGKRDT